MQLLINWLVSALAILVAAYILPGVTVAGFASALIIAFVLGILNVFIKPVLVILTLPINIITLGLFTFIINAFLIWVASRIVPGFTVSSFWSALLFGIVLSIVMYLLHLVFNK
jgi:putative membrane protein